MPCKSIWILSITSLLLQKAWSQGYTTPTSILATQLFDPRIYGIRPQYYSFNEIEPPKPTEQGPVLFPKDTPPPPRTPLIVTSKPLAESIAKSDLNPTPPTTVNQTLIRAEETEQNNQIFKPRYFAKVRNYQPYNLPYNPHFNPGINPGFYPVANDYNLVDSYGNNYDSYGNNYDSYGNGIANLNLNMPTVGRKGGFDGNSYNEDQRAPVLPIYKVIGDHAKQRLADLKSKKIFKKKPEDKLYHDKNNYDNNEIDDTSDLSRNSDYAFSYSVHDKKSGDDFSHSQKSSGTATNGEYRVKLPDGRVQIVSYIADENGYHADVRYDGEDHHHNRKDYKVNPDDERLTGRKVYQSAAPDYRTPEDYNSIANYQKPIDYKSDYKKPVDYYNNYDGYRNDADSFNSNIDFLNSKLRIDNNNYIRQREHENDIRDFEFNTKLLNDKLKYDTNSKIDNIKQNKIENKPKEDYHPDHRDEVNNFKQSTKAYKTNEDYYPDISKESGNDDNINDYSEYEYDDYQHRSKFSNLAKQNIENDKFGVIIVPNINDEADIDNTNNIIATVRPSLQNLRKLFLNRIAASSIPKSSIPVEINVPSTTPKYKTPDSSEPVVLIGGKRNLYTNTQPTIQGYNNINQNIPEYRDIAQYTTSRPYTTPQTYLEATVAALRAQNPSFSEQKPKSSNTFIDRINKYLTFK